MIVFVNFFERIFMSIKYINVALIENKQKLKPKELKQFTLQKSGLEYFTHEVSKLLPKEDAIDESHLSYPRLEEISASQYEALKYILSEYFADFVNQKSTKKHVFSIIRELEQSFLLIDDCLPDSLVKEELIEDYDGYILTDSDLAVLNFIAKIHPQFQIIIEEVQCEEKESTKIIRHYLCNGELVTIHGETKFPNAPLEF